MNHNNTSYVDYVPLLFGTDEESICSWLNECFAYGLTDHKDGRLEMCRALATKLEPKRRPVSIDDRFWENTGCLLDAK